MERVTISDEVAAQLGTVTHPAELCDRNGMPCGIVLPSQFYRELLESWLNQHFTESDLERARAEPGGYSTAEAVVYVNRMIAERAQG